MNTKFTIKNFRVFDENGVTIDLKPLTILTGCNSSGKSSIVKAMLILKHFFMQIKNANDMKAPINLFDYKIDIATEELKSLGNFANTINRVSKSKEVTYEFTIYSLMLSKEVNVSLTFSVDDNDELKNGLLQKVTMRINDQEFYSASRKGSGYSCNLNAIKGDCVDFLELEYLIHGYCSVYGEYNYDDIRSKSNQEYEELLSETKTRIKEYDEKRSKDVLKYVFSSQTQNQDILRRYEISQSIFDWTRKTGSYFWIPVISELDKVGKDGVFSLIDQKLLTEKDTEDMRFASEKIANDFISSDASSFFDYFKNLEEKYFESVKYSDFNFSGVPRIYDFTIKQDYSLMNPDNWVNINIFDEDPTNNKGEEKEEELNNWRNRSVDFPMLYEIVMRWNKNLSEEKNTRNEYYLEIPDILSLGYSHNAFRALGAFLANIVNEVLNPEPWVGIAYTSSSRVEASPYYSLSDNSSFSIALKRYFDARRIYQDRKSQDKPKFEIGSYINQWIKNLEIGDSISFDVIPNLEIVSPKLHKQRGDEGCFLTDVGFGITQLLSVLITVETQILSRIIDASANKGINRIMGLKDLFKMYDNWGLEVLKMRNFLHDTIAIEEPEIHLHPRYQSYLADMFVEAYNKWGVHFVIETHSEYLIRKLQVMVADKECSLKSESVSLNYVDKREDSISYNKQIIIKEDGRLSEPFGRGFFDEAKGLVMKMMKF